MSVKVEIELPEENLAQLPILLDQVQGSILKRRASSTTIEETWKQRVRYTKELLDKLPPSDINQPEWIQNRMQLVL